MTGREVAVRGGAVAVLEPVVPSSEPAGAPGGAVPDPAGPMRLAPRSGSLLVNLWYGQVDYRASVRTWGRTMTAFGATAATGLGFVAVGAPTWVWWSLVPAGVAVWMNELDVTRLWAEEPPPGRVSVDGVMLGDMAGPKVRIRNVATAAQTTGMPGGTWPPLERPAVTVHVELYDGRVLDLPGRALGWRRNPDVVQVEVYIDDEPFVPWMPRREVTLRDTGPGPY